MKRLRKNLIAGVVLISLLGLIGIIFVFLGEEKGQAINVKSEIDKKSSYIGDKIKYTLTVYVNKDIEVEFPEVVEDLANLTVVDFGLAKREFFAKKRLTQWYLLVTYTPDKYTIPKALIRYRGEGEEEWSQIETGEHEIEIKSLLDKYKDTNDIRDIKGPIGYFSKATYLIISIIAIILGILAFFLLRRKRLKNTYIPAKPAHEVAYERLEALKNKSYIREGKIKEYYIELSDIVRHYLEDRFNLRAPEMTTEEFLIKVRDSEELSGAHKNLLREFLSSCDLVKFAKYGPSQSEIDSSFASAKKIIDQTQQTQQTGTGFQAKAEPGSELIGKVSP